MRRIINIRVDGNATIGLGHMMRCIALGRMLKARFEIIFFVKAPDDFVHKALQQENMELRALSDEAVFFAGLSNDSMVVLDGYTFNTAYQQEVKKRGCLLLCIDDVPRQHFVADVILNHAPGISPADYSAEPYTKFCLGPKYSLLRDPFAGRAVPKDNGSLRDHGFLCFGGADPENFTLKYLSALLKEPCFMKLTVVTGGAYRGEGKLREMASGREDSVQLYQNLPAAELYRCIREAGIAIVPASTILIEVLAAGTVPLTGYYVDNQKRIYDGFVAEGAVRGLGDLNHVSGEELMEEVVRLQSRPGEMGNLQENINRIFDGKSSARINEIFPG